MTVIPVALQQAVPIFDTISVSDSVAYATQLNVTGGRFPYTFLIQQHSDYLTVYTNGTINSTGVIPIGTYIVSGTVFDNGGNTGQWVFTLNVMAGPSSPATVVTPVQAAMPTGVEVAVPFRIDPTSGGVAYLSDFKTIVAQHIETICLTTLGERLMMPNYGTSLEGAIFGPMIRADMALIGNDIMVQIQRWEPRVHVDGVIVNEDDPSGLMTVTVNYEILPFTDMNRVQVSAGGTIAQVRSR